MLRFLGASEALESIVDLQQEGREPSRGVICPSLLVGEVVRVRSGSRRSIHHILRIQLFQSLAFSASGTSGRTLSVRSCLICTVPALAPLGLVTYFARVTLTATEPPPRAFE